MRRFKCGSVIQGRWRAVFLLVLSAVAASSLVACKSSESANGNPSIIRFAFQPSEEEMQDNSVRAKLLSDYLKSQLNIPVEVINVTGYAPTIEAMHTGKVDIATFGPMGYLLASQKAGAEPIVAAGNADGKLGTYNSIIAVPKSSSLHSIDDLKAQAKNLTFMFVDPASTSGYLIPRAYLQSIGLNPEKDFGKVIFAGSQVAGILTIKAGKIDAGSVMQQLLIPRLISLGKLAPDDLRVLWTSEPIPHSPICVRSTLPGPLKQKIQQAMLDIPKKDPALWEVFKNTYRLPDMTFVPVSESNYAPLRKYADQIKDLNINEK
jgi:phosphonate transport system substrate-binding protein